MLARPLSLRMVGLLAAVAAASWPLAASAVPSSAIMYGVDNNSDIYEVDPVAKTFSLALSSTLTSGTSNSLAFDSARDQLFFIGTGTSLFTWTKGSGSVQSLGAVPGNPNDPNNAAFYNDAYWYFDFNSNDLYKLSLSYSGGVPSISGTSLYSINGMNLPPSGTVGFNTNTFGDVAINTITGMLYASTTRGRFYSVNLNGDPTNTFTEIAPAIAPVGTDNTYGLQLAFNTDSSVLYGHSYESGDWYTVSLADGARTSIDFTTTPFAGKGFRDLGGSTVAVPEPPTFALAVMGLSGGLGWHVLRRRNRCDA
ncbi:MAG: PEP-CTERM sorting domain-containing protein [Planctomycetaceae bacterium]